MLDRPRLPCPTCPGTMDARSKVCRNCAVAVQKATFTIPKRRPRLVVPYFEERRRMKRFRSM